MPAEISRKDALTWHMPSSSTHGTTGALLDQVFRVFGNINFLLPTGIRIEIYSNYLRISTLYKFLYSYVH